jgi:hypothetical protein
MAKRTLTIRKNSDGTVTIGSGRYVEHVDVKTKTPEKKFEAVKWAILTAGFYFSEEVEKMVREVVDYYQ